MEISNRIDAMSPRCSITVPSEAGLFTEWKKPSATPSVVTVAGYAGPTAASVIVVVKAYHQSLTKSTWLLYLISDSAPYATRDSSEVA